MVRIGTVLYMGRRGGVGEAKLALWSNGMMQTAQNVCRSPQQITQGINPDRWQLYVIPLIEAILFSPPTTAAATNSIPATKVSASVRNMDRNADTRPHSSFGGRGGLASGAASQGMMSSTCMCTCCTAPTTEVGACQSRCSPHNVEPELVCVK